jgi:hypothetical protein
MDGPVAACGEFEGGPAARASRQVAQVMLALDEVGLHQAAAREAGVAAAQGRR